MEDKNMTIREKLESIQAKTKEVMAEIEGALKGLEPEGSGQHGVRLFVNMPRGAGLTAAKRMSERIAQILGAKQDTFDAHTGAMFFADQFMRGLQEGMEASKTKDEKLQPLTGFAAVRYDIRHGHIDNYRVGDIIKTTHDELGEIEWRIIGINHDGLLFSDCAKYPFSGVPRITVQTVNTVGYGQFDAPTKGHPWGDNAWVGSEIREWLHHDFLGGMSCSDLNTLALCNKKTHTPDGIKEHADRIFLLSASEIGFKVDNKTIHDEGEVYEYYKQATGDYDDEEPLRQMVDNEGDKTGHWLRSPNPWNASDVRRVYPDGSLSYIGAHGGSGAAPACVIW